MAELQIADTEPNDDSDVQLAVLAAQTADDKKATDILILEVGEVLAIAGYFVVCSASNPRLVRTVADETAKSRLLAMCCSRAASAAPTSRKAIIRI